MDLKVGWGGQSEGGDGVVGGFTVRMRGNESGDCDEGRNRRSFVKMS